MEEILNNWLQEKPKDKFDKELHKYTYYDLIEFAEYYHTLQLQQTGVMRSACKHDEENDTKAYAKNGNEFIGYYCEKCDSVYCGSI